MYAVYFTTAIGEVNQSIVDPNSGAMVSVGALAPDDDLWHVLYSVSGTVSCFSSLDTRVAIVLATDLQVRRSICIVDNAEINHYALGEWPLTNMVQTHTTCSDEFHSTFTVQSYCRAGQYELVNPSHPVSEWKALSPDSNVRQLRVRLYIRERIYQGANRWKTVLKPLVIGSHTSWSCKLIFVEKSE